MLLHHFSRQPKRINCSGNPTKTPPWLQSWYALLHIYSFNGMRWSSFMLYIPVSVPIGSYHFKNTILLDNFSRHANQTKCCSSPTKTPPWLQSSFCRSKQYQIHLGHNIQTFHTSWSLWQTTQTNQLLWQPNQDTTLVTKLICSS
jgi:hypothetical protein